MASKPPRNGLSVLKQRSQFLALLKKGQKVRPSDWLLINFAPNDVGVLRCGWTLPRHVGSAVIRNRLKRWSRVYFRALIKASGDLPGDLSPDEFSPDEFSIDINLVFRKAENDFYRRLDYERFSEVLDRGWQQVRRRMR